MIYFDNGATTRPYKDVVDLIAKISYEDFGNPSSLHALGIRAEKILENSRKKVAETIRAEPGEIVFTSGGTESINMALKGTASALKREGKHILSTPIEHSASLESLKALQGAGYDVEMLHVDTNGLLDLDDLKRKLRQDTILVNIMLVNNEIGTIEPVTEAGHIIKMFNPGIAFHVDAVQGYGKVNINTKNLKADLMSFSGHKIHAPKGVGMLYVRKGARVHPILSGGSQENLMRPGTVNVPVIAGFAQAAARKVVDMDQDNHIAKRVRDRLISELQKKMPDKIRVNSPNDGLPGIVNISFSSIKSEVILHALEMDEIYVSSGSACSSRKQGVSHVIKELHIPEPWADGAIRFSFSGENTEEEAAVCAEKLLNIVNTFRIRG